MAWRFLSSWSNRTFQTSLSVPCCWSCNREPGGKSCLSPPVLPFLKLRAWRWQEQPDAVDAQPIAWIFRMSWDGYFKNLWKSIWGLSSERQPSLGSIWFIEVSLLTIFLWILKMSDCRKMKPSSAIIWKIDITIRWFSYFLSLAELTFSLLEDVLLLSRRMKITSNPQPPS